MATKVCLVADTHGVLDERIADRVRRCDIAVHAGDIGAVAVLEALCPRSGEVYAVLGNNDVPAKWPAPDRERLSRLPERLALPLPGGVLAVEHGHRITPAAQRHRRLRQRHPDARAVVYGHSHRLLVDQDEIPWVLNPGAAGRARTFGGATCLVLVAGPRVWSVRAGNR